MYSSAFSAGRRNILRELINYRADVMCLQVSVHRSHARSSAILMPSHRIVCQPAPWSCRHVAPKAHFPMPIPQEVQADHFENFIEPELAKYEQALLSPQL